MTTYELQLHTTRKLSLADDTPAEWKELTWPLIAYEVRCSLLLSVQLNMDQLLDSFVGPAGLRRSKGEMDDAQDNLELVEAEHEPIDDLDAEDDDEPQHNEEGSLWRPRKKPVEDRSKMLQYLEALPYPAESIEDVDAQLEHIMTRLADAVYAKDYDHGFIHWSRCLEMLFGLRMPLKREHRVTLVKLYWTMATFDGLEVRVNELAAQICISLIENVKRIDIYDVQLPWRPLFDMIDRQLFPKARKAGGGIGLPTIAYTLLELASRAQRFFPPHEARAMLEAFLPRFDIFVINPCLAAQSYMVHFIPLSHPTEWLDTVFALWPSFQSSYWDTQWLELVTNLAEKHLDPSISDPRVVDDLRRRASDDSDGQMDTDEEARASRWPGIRKDVGIFRASEWSFLMTKCIRSMGISVGAGSGSATLASNVDKTVDATSITMQRPVDKFHDFARLLVYSIGPDGQALRDLAKFMHATESFYHPSNVGAWSRGLSHFLSGLGSCLARRVHEESKPTCKTPQAWRLTPADRQAFVEAIRTASLLSMFGKDMSSVSSAIATLRCCGHLEPERIMPLVLDRVYPALEGVLETSRTLSAISVLGSLSSVLVDRQIYPAGPKHFVPLGELLVAGIDINDPSKTLTTSLYFCHVLLTIHLEDLTHPDLLPEPTDDHEMNGESEDELTRNTTAGLPDLIERILRAIFNIFDNLPEPGKNGKVGGRSEETMTNSLSAVGEFLLASLSDTLFDLALDIFYDHYARSPRANCARAVSHFIGSFGRRDSLKTLDRIVPLCVREIISELDNGASSVPSTSTASHGETDIALQWYSYLLSGAVSHITTESLEAHGDTLIKLVATMRERCKSERGYAHTARLLSNLFTGPIAYYSKDTRPYNAEEYAREHFQRTSLELWGKQYEAKEINWHVPGDREITFVLRILREIAAPILGELEQLLHAPRSEKLTDRIWANDFCRRLAILKTTFSGFFALIGLPSAEPAGESVSDRPDSIPGFHERDIKVVTGIVLPDEKDVRHQEIRQLQHRIGRFLHDAAVHLKDVASDDSFDAVKMLISSIRIYCTEVPFDTNTYHACKKNYDFIRQFTRYAKGQSKFPRIVWLRRAHLYHFTRLKVLSINRKRNAIEDALIYDLCDFSLSRHVSVRKPAQRAFESVIKCLDGVRAMTQSHLLEAIKPGVDVDVMKGALHVLSFKPFQNYNILHWQHLPRVIMAILRCQHQEKQSIQKLVAHLANSLIVKHTEPSTLPYELDTTSSRAAADHLYVTAAAEPDLNLRKRLEDGVKVKVNALDTQWNSLIAELLKLARDPKTHHRYATMTLRFLRNSVRRDLPQSAELAAYFCGETMSELPHQRAWAIPAVSKMLHFVKLRSFAQGSASDKARNPLKVTVDVPQPADEAFTARFNAAFTEPITQDSILLDKQTVGNFVWGKTYTAYRPPPAGDEYALVWEEASRPALKVIRDAVGSKKFWDHLVNHYSQEMSREYMAADNTVIVKSIFQMYDDLDLLDSVLLIVEPLITDVSRHKQRAGAEVVGGIIRGIKHWPESKRDHFWSWYTPKLGKIMTAMTIETQSMWEMHIEFALQNRDPRRNKPLLDWLLSLTFDHRSTDPFAQGKIAFMLVSAQRSLAYRFTPFAAPFRETMWASLDSPYQEVRSAVSEMLYLLSHVQLSTSLPSVDVLLERGRRIAASPDEPPLFTMDTQYQRQAATLHEQLARDRTTRKPLASGEQVYDETALTILYFLQAAVADFRIMPVYPFVSPLLPDFFAMQDVQDNEELNRTAREVLLSIAILPYPTPVVNELMRSLAELLSTSTAWRLRLNVLPMLQVLAFYQLFTVEDDLLVKLLGLFCDLLRDDILEVRDQASRTLSNLVRFSEEQVILGLKERFLATLRTTKVPKRRDEAGKEVAGYQNAVKTVHAGVLGAAALVSAFPYTVPSWLPSLLLEVANSHGSSPAPISTSVKTMLADFKASHQDSWSEGQKAFTPDEIAELNDLYQGGSYYA